MSDANETVVRRFVDEVINEGDYSAMRELLHPNYVYRSPDQELRGAEALKSLLTTYRSGLPDLKTSIDDLIVSGDKDEAGMCRNRPLAGLVNAPRRNRHDRP